jgi:hypothetical protein
MIWIIVGAVVYVIASFIHFYMSLYRKHRNPTTTEKVFDAFFYPGVMGPIYVATGISTLFGWNK